MAVTVRRALVGGSLAGGRAVEDDEALRRVKRVGTGLCFMAFLMIINLMAAVGMAGAMVPYGAGLVRDSPAPIGMVR